MNSMLSNTCPHCQTPIYKELRAEHFYTCENCKKPFIHSDTTLKESLVPYTETLSPIVIGSRGKIKSESFEITGCITLFQNNSVVNLFCLLWQHGLYGFLIETEGKYSVTDFIDEKPSQSLRMAKLGKTLDIEKYGSLYCFSTSKTEEVSLNGEGKLYFPALRNSLFCSFFNTNKKVIYAVFSRTETFLLSGNFYKLEELNLSSVKNGKAWHSLRVFPQPLELPCPECKTGLRLFANYRVHHVSCGSCGSIARFNEEGQLKTIKKLPITKTSTFKIGTELVIEETEFILISYTVKKETNYNTEWTEYTLFNPLKGTWFLSESEGHYNLLKPSRFFITETSKILRDVEKDGARYPLYTKYKFTIKHAGGEFLTNMLTSPIPACADYTVPPHILSYESSSEEINWFEGEYCDHEKVKSWLKESVELQRKEGIAPNQPFALNFDQESLIRLSVIAFFSIILIQILLSALITTSTPVYSKSYGLVDSLSTRSIVSEPFTISENNCAVDFVLHGNVNNTWLEADFTLVNETTGDQYYFGKAIEYYSGVEDGESWHEGAQDETVTVNSVKKGKYHLNILLNNDGGRSYHQIDVTVIENVPLMKNFLITLACLVVFPLFIFYRRRNFDRKQWYNSNYSPYTYD